MTADDRVERSREQKGKWSVVRLPAHAARFVPPKLCGQDFMRHFLGLGKHTPILKKERKETLDKENEVMPKRNGTATSMEKSISVLPGHVLLIACFAPTKFHVTCSWA